jgi:hypothetical protein
VTITAPAGLADRGLYGGYIVLTPQDGSPLYRVPYAGFKGDYQSIQVLTPTANGFPWLAKSGRQLVVQTGRRRELHARGRRRSILPAAPEPSVAPGAPRGVRCRQLARRGSVASDDQYLPRNSTSSGFFSFTWDGVTFSRKRLMTPTS